jgi:hypothetical protein
MSQVTKKRKTNVVLSLFVYSRGVGVAVLEDALTVLNAYNMVVHKYPVSNKELLKKIKEKIDFYLPEVVVLEDAKGYGSRKSKRVEKLIKQIEDYAITRGLTVTKYSRNDIRFVFGSFNAHSKYEIAKVITENIKQLPVQLPEKRKSHEPEHYSMTIFDSISLGITHFYMKE